MSSNYDASFVCGNNCSDMGKSEIYEQEKQRAQLLKEFRRALQDVIGPEHDDQFMLKWLIARDFDLIKAEKMLRDNFVFRKKIGSDTILNKDHYQLPEVVQKYNITTSLGYDNENDPVRLFCLGLGDLKGYINSLSMLDIYRIFVYFLEYDINMIKQKKKETGNVSMKATYIIDYTQFSLRNFYTKQVIAVAIRLLTMYQDNYPEHIKTAYLVNVPSYFSFVFNAFKPFMNAVTLSKMRIVSTGEVKKVLQSMMDPKLLPAYLGGDLTSPDGDSKCPHLINWKSKIDHSFYLKHKPTDYQDHEEDPAMTTTTVQQRGSLDVPVEVDTTGLVIRWCFSTNGKNIRFGLFLKRNNGQLEEVIPVENIECQVIPEENEFVCHKTGTYLLHFDNSYSWLTSKQISYKVEVETMESLACKN
ncbi:hypothetical protein JTE90_006424 [Oedothorax gibbosus]|uniref:SEC14-like protein 2 n=1 Tax=Oedothorax gibbosus TaxID=931172 RepID=A0AAV6TYB1_9ARAC|nr:hypothetical protein JTE90_006424 [Oedothorax gibbosus]